MNIESTIYKNALRKASTEIARVLSTHRLRGLEAIMQEHLCTQLAKRGYLYGKEALLQDYGGQNLWKNSGKPRVDILIQSKWPHAIELKVIRLPEYEHSGLGQRLWNLGQITSDYWRIKKAEGIHSGELGILVVGDLVRIARTAGRIVAEFHNAMYINYVVSAKWGELRIPFGSKTELSNQRTMQIRALKEMGLAEPFLRMPTGWVSVVVGDYAYIKIPIQK